jgi:hypothetical protein
MSIGADRGRRRRTGRPDEGALGQPRQPDQRALGSCAKRRSGAGIALASSRPDDGRANSRMKDFYDIWILPKTFDSAPERLARAMDQNGC